MHLKILSIKKTAEFNKVSKIANKFVVSNFIILTAPTPKTYFKKNQSEIKDLENCKKLQILEQKNHSPNLDKDHLQNNQNSLIENKNSSKENKNSSLDNSKKIKDYYQKQQFFIDNFCRVGYTVSKNVSKLANQRNLIKRRLREILKANIKYLYKHQDYIIIARSPILKASNQIIIRDFIFAIKGINNNHKKNIKKNA
jgi:ribonuclease P protein component